MTRSRATRLGRACLLLPMLLVTACAAVPLTAQESVANARLSVAQLESRAFTLDVQLVRALGGGFRAA